MSDPHSVPQKPPFEETEAYREAIRLSVIHDQSVESGLREAELNAVRLGFPMDFASIRESARQGSKAKLEEYLAQLRQRYERGE